ncbi:hypothetical protein [Sinorhizobium meliloti]|uniref:hypothetical protein n=1 Tax=Rhizobium meliloti TaxID=382 RepID=UPI002090973D|nr:hypothetical protein [Sinorhizobium meliloti]MCO5966394.1 hypothetical protein [Sinorhizobium meliloti]
MNVKRLLMFTGVNLTAATGFMAAIGDIARFRNPRSWLLPTALNFDLCPFARRD